MSRMIKSTRHGDSDCTELCLVTPGPKSSLCMDTICCITRLTPITSESKAMKRSKAMRKLPEVDACDAGTLSPSLYHSATSSDRDVFAACGEGTQSEEVFIGDSMMFDGFYVGSPSSRQQDLVDCSGSPVWPTVLKTNHSSDDSSNSDSSASSSSCESDPIDILQFVSPEELLEDKMLRNECAYLQKEHESAEPKWANYNRPEATVRRKRKSFKTTNGTQNTEDCSRKGSFETHQPELSYEEFSMDDIFQPEMAGDLECRR